MTKLFTYRSTRRISLAWGHVKFQWPAGQLRMKEALKVNGDLCLSDYALERHIKSSTKTALKRICLQETFGKQHVRNGDKQRGPGLK